MNLLVTLNSNYITPLCVMLKSLMLSNPNGNFDLYVAHSSLTENDFNLIDKSIDKCRTAVHSIEVDPKILDSAPVLKRISKETYYRLLITDYLPKEVDRILYIDPDTVVINDISEFYNIDFGDCVLAAASHTGPFREFLNRPRFRYPKGHRYFNAGIIMFNVDMMRKLVNINDIFDYIRRHEKWLFLADQDVLNGMFNDKTLFVDECIYNLDEKTVSHNKKRVTDLDWVRKNTVIVHFNGSYKPWKPNYRGILAPLYFEYKEQLDID
ncbi:MAG: glycosyltransferase family 8 protein [Faecalibacterium sp.]|nr:glycosyltransferase family 8 protein [Ruminococcus sp.]MCM1486151.1 glycosyltransferase family 8 protein [Faecalibacterium sp.]